MTASANAVLPPGWELAEMGDFGMIVCGQSPPSASVNRQGRGTPYVSGPEHWDGAVVHLDKWTTHPVRVAPVGAVFVTVKGAGVGTVFPGAAAAIGRDVYAYAPENGVSQSFVTHALRYTTAAVVRHAKGDIPGLSKDDILRHRVPLPPSSEQERIASAIDELHSDVDAGVASLKQARAKLNAYRASLLKSAVDGTLTAGWRDEHPNVESASVLLERILADRRARWEAEQLAKFEAKGLRLLSNWRSRYVDPVAADTTDIPQVAQGWTVASMDALTTRVTSGSRDWQRYYGAGTGTFIMAQNVRPGFLDRSTRQAVNPPLDDSSCERSRVEIDDLLVTIVGANTGDVCRVSAALREHYVCQSVALMRPVERSIARYLEYYAISAGGAQLHYRRYTYGAGRPHLSFDQLKMTPVLLPPVVEQEAIVEIVEDQLSVIDHLEADLDAKLLAAQSLRQSILRDAFTGRLVPQDPNDEPASELLERITAERVARQAAASPKARSRRGRKAI